MAKINRFFYLVDKLDSRSTAVMEKSLNMIPEIHSVSISPKQGLVEVYAKKDVEDQVKLACDVAGSIFRTKIKKKELI
jgi:hypothetical protein